MYGITWTRSSGGCTWPRTGCWNWRRVETRRTEKITMGRAAAVAQARAGEEETAEWCESYIPGRNLALGIQSTYLEGGCIWSGVTSSCAITTSQREWRSTPTWTSSRPRNGCTLIISYRRTTGLGPSKTPSAATWTLSTPLSPRSICQRLVRSRGPSYGSMTKLPMTRPRTRPIGLLYSNAWRTIPSAYGRHSYKTWEFWGNRSYIVRCSDVVMGSSMTQGTCLWVTSWNFSVKRFYCSTPMSTCTGKWRETNAPYHIVNLYGCKICWTKRGRIYRSTLF